MDDCPFKNILKTCVGSLSQSNVKKSELKFQSGVDNINNASKKRGLDVIVKKGMLIHTDCRKRYINTDGDKNIIKKRKTENGSIAIDSQGSVSLRSKSSNGFRYSTHCLLCETIAVDEKGDKLDDVYQIRSYDSQRELEKSCKVRLNMFINGDEWTEKGEIE